MKREYNRLGQVLKKQGRTNRWFAKKLSVTETTVSRWVHNLQQPTVPMLYKMGVVLDVEPRNLLVRLKDLEQLLEKKEDLESKED